MHKDLPTLALGLEGIKVKSISAGWGHTCAVIDLPSDNLLCTGDNLFGQLGIGSNGKNFNIYYKYLITKRERKSMN